MSGAEVHGNHDLRRSTSGGAIIVSLFVKITMECRVLGRCCLFHSVGYEVILPRLVQLQGALGRGDRWKLEKGCDAGAGININKKGYTQYQYPYS